MNPLENRILGGTSSNLKRVLLGEQLPLIPRLGLFVLFTVLLVFLTIILLPQLVVLGPWGYVAGFIINCLSSAVVVLPGPGFAALIIMAKELDPFLLGIAAGIGGTFGELTGYWLGAQGRETLEGNRIYALIRRAMSHLGGGILVCFGLLPFLPVDAAGILAGASGYPVSKFLFYVGIGKTLMTVSILCLAARAFEWAEPYLTWLG
jgi:membrane protein YqaA with SNARE-associated domain